jgi:hypothetical protein
MQIKSEPCRARIACQTCDVGCKVETILYKTNRKNYNVQFSTI